MRGDVRKSSRKHAHVLVLLCSERGIVVDYFLLSEKGRLRPDQCLILNPSVRGNLPGAELRVDLREGSRLRDAHIHEVLRHAASEQRQE